MQFEWDDQKAARNLEVHEVSFLTATAIFFDPDRQDAADTRADYGEERRITVGRIEGRFYVVVYTMRGDMVRLISARRANQREVKKWQL